MPETTDPIASDPSAAPHRTHTESGERLGAAIRSIVLLTVFMMTYWNRADFRSSGLDLAVGVGAIYVLLSTFPAIWGGRSWRERAIIFTCLDILLISWLVGASGGMSSEFYMLYYLPVLQAGMRLNLRDAVGAALLSAVCYVLVWLTTGPLLQEIHTSAVLRMATFAASAIVLAVLLALVSREIREERGLRARSSEALAAATLIYELTRTLGATLDLSQMMREFIDAAVARLGADAGRVLLVHSALGDLRVAAVAGQPEGLFDEPAAETARGVAVWVRECAEPVLVADPSRRPDLGGQPVAWPEAAGSWVAAPMLAGGDVVGVVELARRSRSSPFAPADLDVLAAVAAQAGVGVANALRHEEVELQAITDPLTGLWNHGEFQVRLGEEISRARRHGHPASLILADVDGFRAINDQYGHRAGDELLRQVAALVRRILRGCDIAARYGGDDFAIILPETTREGARVAAENLRRRVAERTFVVERAPEGVSVTFSIGVVAYPQDGDSPEAIVDAVSAAVSAARSAGGNRVVMHGEEQT